MPRQSSVYSIKELTISNNDTIRINSYLKRGIKLPSKHRTIRIMMMIFEMAPKPAAVCIYSIKHTLVLTCFCSFLIFDA